LNYIYKSEPALWQQDDSYDGFEWIDFHDADNSVVSFVRKSREAAPATHERPPAAMQQLRAGSDAGRGEMIVFIVNATPIVRHNYRLGVPRAGFYREIINTDADTYGGSNVGNLGGVQSEGVHWMEREHSILIQLPPLATVAFKFEE
jgi:1,4-alpha-glucan branching enzyme